MEVWHIRIHRPWSDC